MPTSFTLYANPPTGSAVSVQLHGGTQYKLGMNDATGPRFTPLAPASKPLWSGGGFTDGADLVGVSFDNVTETIPLLIRGTSVDNCISLKQALVRLFHLGSKTRPMVVQFQPNGATNAQYAEVYQADLQESTDFINEEAGRFLMRCQLVWTRESWWTPASRSNATVNGALFDNTSSGGTNYGAWGSSLSGDLIYRGQPVSIDVTSNGGTWTSGTTLRSILLATINGAPTYLTRGDTISTTSTVGGTLGSPSDTSAGVATVGGAGIETRVIGRLSGTPANLEMRISVYYGAAAPGTGALIYRSEWTTVIGVARTMVDFGGFTLPPNLARSPSSQQGIRIQPEIRSVGGTATGTLDGLEVLQCYTFCRIDSTIPIPGGNASVGCRVLVFSIDNASNPVSHVQVWRAPKVLWLYNAVTMDIPRVSGTVPVAIQGTNLWAAWMSGGAYTTSDQLSVAANYSPLYASLRGAG